MKPAGSVGRVSNVVLFYFAWFHQLDVSSQLSDPVLPRRRPCWCQRPCVLSIVTLICQDLVVLWKHTPAAVGVCFSARRWKRSFLSSAAGVSVSGRKVLGAAHV